MCFYGRRSERVCLGETALPAAERHGPFLFFFLWRTRDIKLCRCFFVLFFFQKQNPAAGVALFAFLFFYRSSLFSLCLLGRTRRRRHKSGFDRRDVRRPQAGHLRRAENGHRHPQASPRQDEVCLSVPPRVGMGWDGMGWDGMAWDGMAWHGMRWDGIIWDVFSSDVSIYRYTLRCVCEPSNHVYTNPPFSWKCLNE